MFPWNSNIIETTEAKMIQTRSIFSLLVKIGLEGVFTSFLALM